MPPYPQWDPVGSAEEGHSQPAFLVVKAPTHLEAEGSQAQATNRGKEQRWHCDLNEERGNHAEFVQPDRQVVSKPGSGRGQALRLVMVGEGCR